ncbi:MAG: ABC transporter permease, partial [Alphaproteobacteria bacterium]|nr:ABC transporter permease [Alphaproteobacteria bacterium]
MTAAEAAMLRPRPHADDLTRDARRERATLFGLSLPALALVTITMIAPVAWLFGLSLFADDGSLSLVHYRRLVEQ